MVAKKVYVNEEYCIGCQLCEVYCKLQHSRYNDLIKAYKKELAQIPSRIRVERNGNGAITVRCQHCDDAPCASACLTGALQFDPGTGELTFDENRCIGCWTCLIFCPVGAITQNMVSNTTLRCDLCQGETIPVCVQNCPNGALEYTE